MIIVYHEPFNIKNYIKYKTKNVLYIQCIYIWTQMHYISII